MQGKQVRENQLTAGATPPGQQGSRPTIGLLASELWDLWRGVSDATQERGVNLLSFPGWELRDPRGFHAQSNVLYDLVSAEKMDGLVIWSAGLSNYVDRETIQDFCERYRPLPIVSVGMVLEGMPSVLLDNYQGVHEVMVHLIEVHGYRRIAFIRGPEGQPEAEERYHAYSEVLKEYGLSCDPDFVSSPKTWAPASAAEAIHQLLDQRKVDFEAVMAANDSLARGALEALQARGIRVPGDVAVVGFDNDREGRVLTPPLTTVPNQHYEMGKRSVEMLLMLLAGKQAPERVDLPTKLVVRQSCGCLSQAALQAATGKVEATEEMLEAVFTAQRECILSEMRQAMGISLEDMNLSWAEQLLDAFSAELQDGSPRAFWLALEDALQQAAARDGDVVLWQGALSVLRRHALPCLINDKESLSQAEDLWGQARVLIGEVAQRARIYQGLSVENRAEALRGVGQALITTFDVAELLDVVARELPRVGIEGCYLSLYEDSESPAEWSRLILAYDQQGRVDLGASGRRFPSRQLLPDGLLPHERQFGMVVAPLYFREEQLGLALFEWPQGRGWSIHETWSTYNALRGQLSSALKGALLVQQVEDHARQLQTTIEVSRAVGSILDPAELIQQMVELVLERFELYYVGLFVVDQTGEWTGEPGRWAVLRAGTGEAGQEMLKQGHKLEIGGASMIGWCVAHKQARIALDVGMEAVRFSNPLLPETRSEMALPLISRDQPIGALTIQSSQKAAFSEEDRVVLQTLAGQLANAIENARLFDRTQAALEEVESTHRRYLHQAWTEYLPTVKKASYETERPDVAPLGDAVLPEIQQAVERQSATVLTGDEVGGGSQSALVAPIVLHGAILGALGIHDDDGARQWTEDEIALIEAVAERMALVVENLRLLDETQRRSVREQQERETAARVRSSVNVDTILRTAVRELGQTLGAAGGLIRLEVVDDEV